MSILGSPKRSQSASVPCFYFCVVFCHVPLCRFLLTLLWIFHVFSRWQGRRGLRGKHTTTEASTPSSSPMAVVAAHTTCQARAVGRGKKKTRTYFVGCPVPRCNRIDSFRVSMVTTLVTREMVVRCRKRHKGELKFLCTRKKRMQRVRTVWCAARTTLTFPS